jgi:hypothetical protein
LPKSTRAAETVSSPSTFRTSASSTGFLNNDQISALNNLGVPVTVNVPIGVAANVCNVSAAVLAGQRGTGAAPCDAKSGSKALAQNVITQKLNQKRGK